MFMGRAACATDRESWRWEVTIDLVAALETWYAGNCDGDWEHELGVRLGTLDNPGWLLDIDLEGTPLQGRAFSRVQEDRTENDWVRCWVEANVFKGRGGPRNLGDLLRIFTSWTEAESGGDPRSTSQHSDDG
jgi:hypothetical protein